MILDVQTRARLPNPSSLLEARLRATILCLSIFIVDLKYLVLLNETVGCEIDGFLVEVTYSFARAYQSCSIMRLIAMQIRGRIPALS